MIGLLWDTLFWTPSTILLQKLVEFVGKIMRNDKLKSGDYYKGKTVDCDVYFAQMSIWVTIGLVVKTFGLIIQFGNMHFFEQVGGVILNPFRDHNFEKQLFV